MRTGFSFIFLLLFTLLAALPVRAADYLTESRSRPFLDTTVTMDLCFVDGRQDDVGAILDSVWKRLDELAARADSGKPRSDVSLLNAAGGRPVRLHEDIYRLFSAARGVMLRTDGMFDITIAPLSDLWRGAARQGSLPALRDITEARQHVGPDKLELSGDGMARLTDPSGKIELNVIASAFAVDEAVGMLKKARFFNFMIRAGQVVYVRGSNCQGRAWRMDVRDPDRHDKIIDRLEPGEVAVASSGDNVASTMIQGRRWSGLMNPMTGYPQNGVAGVTVLAPSAVEACAWSVALGILGPAQGLRRLEEMGEGYDALVLFRREGGRYEWHSSPGYEDRRVNQSN
ncbi:MAG: FAD:protein FMN transferase [Candidatus Omnitrophica bacterium]|nr:FAD:protein FMN transferase [Candidatus Omnitrophota bacterium]